MKRTIRPFVLLVAALCQAAPVSAANLVTNGDFEIPDTTPNPLIEVPANSTLILGQSQLNQWTQDVKAGKTPDFGANLVY